jgi:hypothetical protein
MEKLLAIIGGVVVLAIMAACGVMGYIGYSVAAGANQVPVLFENTVATLEAPSVRIITVEAPAQPAQPAIIMMETTAVPLATNEPLPTYTPYPTYTPPPTVPSLTSLPFNGPYSPENIAACQAIWAAGAQTSLISPQYELCLRYMEATE